MLAVLSVKQNLVFRIDLKPVLLVCPYCLIESLMESEA